jgi:exodeoxyribonuclease VII small subunit
VKAKKEEDVRPFEEGLEKLESIVRQLEAGEKGLEDSLALFEEGIALARKLNGRLDEIKHRVEVLIQEGDTLRAEPFKDTGGG